MEVILTVDASLSPRTAYVGLLPFLALPIAMWFIFSATVQQRDIDPASASLVTAAIAIVVGVVAHEGLHGLTWLSLGGLQRADLEFGFSLKAFAPYCHCRVVLPAQVYIAGALAPLLVLGLAPFAVALITGSEDWLHFSLFMTVAALGDLLVVAMLVRFPLDAMVRDHPSRVGFLVNDS